MSCLKLDEINSTVASEKVPFFLGRLQPPSRKHVQIFNTMYKDHGIAPEIFVVKSDNPESPFSFEVISAILTKCLDIPYNIYLVDTGFIGNVIDILRNNGKEPTYLYCGSDRKESYQKQIDRYKEKLNLDINIVEIERLENTGVSATKVREALKTNNVQQFKENIDQKVWDMFATLEKEIHRGN